ncbi:uncharacterized protein PAC_04228 [Phialocephala subalpina]|uniref:Uncharacterized protein n=1 Tax=Phialocephala subalpina TaxID=576137 RepID=A0A1L7WNK1_9HELO|nr:uncharacterized protein PAC_04228 [Phialocephala subalpina]
MSSTSNITLPRRQQDPSLSSNNEQRDADFARFLGYGFKEASFHVAMYATNYILAQCPRSTRPPVLNTKHAINVRLLDLLRPNDKKDFKKDWEGKVTKFTITENIIKAYPILAGPNGDTHDKIVARFWAAGALSGWIRTQAACMIAHPALATADAPARVYKPRKFRNGRKPLVAGEKYLIKGCELVILEKENPEKILGVVSLLALVPNSKNLAFKDIYPRRPRFEKPVRVIESDK